jgi:hypothetical protein
MCVEFYLILKGAKVGLLLEVDFSTVVMLVTGYIRDLKLFTLKKQ